MRQKHMTSPIAQSRHSSSAARIPTLEINRQTLDSLVRIQTTVRKTLNDTREDLYKSRDAGTTSGTLVLRLWLGSACLMMETL